VQYCATDKQCPRVLPVHPRSGPVRGNAIDVAVATRSHLLIELVGVDDLSERGVTTTQRDGPLVTVLRRRTGAGAGRDDDGVVWNGKGVLLIEKGPQNNCSSPRWRVPVVPWLK
jgi:hypothetical protein